MIRGNYGAAVVFAASHGGQDSARGNHEGRENTVTDVAERLARKGDRGEPVRQMRLALAHIGVWSSTKLAFVLSVCLNVVTVVLLLLVVRFLTDTEVFSSVTGVFEDLTNKPVNLGQFLDPGVVGGFIAAVVLLNTVLITTLGALYALLFNLSVRVTGGTFVGFRNS
ncbi:hypothetical protein CTB96_14390 [Cryobacterium arcticum]|uniref:DUF3566 domain-containing protein n=2 Tax=Cryobacterium arcticum TaxID=670052 RepID=A0A317ZN34_9MICO|nr:hypothetical protein CTB96_14390 [Cryobacterium arcticum]